MSVSFQAIEGASKHYEAHHPATEACLLCGLWQSVLVQNFCVHSLPTEARKQIICLQSSGHYLQYRKWKQIPNKYQNFHFYAFSTIVN
jgi:hypothetical protein